MDEPLMDCNVRALSNWFVKCYADHYAAVMLKIFYGAANETFRVQQAHARDQRFHRHRLAQLSRWVRTEKMATIMGYASTRRGVCAIRISQRA